MEVLKIFHFHFTILSDFKAYKAFSRELLENRSADGFLIVIRVFCYLIGFSRVPSLVPLGFTSVKRQ